MSDMFLNECIYCKQEKFEHHAHVPISLPWISKMLEDEKQTRKGSVC